MPRQAVARVPEAPEPPAAAQRRQSSGPGAAQVLALQRGAGNRATAQMVQRGLFGDTIRAIKRAVGVPHEVAVAGERVIVKTAAEETEAADIIAAIESTHGVDVSSVQGVKSTLDNYSNAPKAERDKVKAKPWLMSELRAVKRALGHFGRILGANRASSTRSGVAQEVTSVGKATFSIDDDSASGAVDQTLGQYYAGDRNFTMYGRGETSDIDFPGDIPKQQEATATHEIAHGLMAYALPGFIAASDYWLDRNTKSGTAGAEAPPTPYGAKNAAEDMCESVMFYFVAPKRLKDGRPGKSNGEPGNPCPKRYAYLKKAIDGWEPPPPVGDFPTPDESITALA